VTTVVETPEGPIPVPLPLGGHPPPVPHIGNPLPEWKYDFQQGWHGVASAVSGLWHGALSFLDRGAGVVVGDVENIVEAAINANITAWSSFISTLEDWIVVGIDEVGTALDIVSGSFADQVITLLDLIEGVKADALTWALDTFNNARIYTDQVIDALRADVLRGLADVETWAIDNIEHPLLNDIATVRADLLDWIEARIGQAEAYARDLTDTETLARVAAIAGLAAALARIATWVEECGAPMCETYGPNTDLTKLLKGLEGLLTILAGVGLANLTEADVETLAGYFSAVALGDVEGFVNAFTRDGRTLGSSAGTVISDIGHIAAEAFAEVSGL